MPATQPAADARRIAWHRHGKACQHCQAPLALEDAHVDQIVHRPIRPNFKINNLTVYCRRCFVLRLGPKGLYREGLIAQALADGIIPADWRPHVWEDDK